MRSHAGTKRESKRAFEERNAVGEDRGRGFPAVGGGEGGGGGICVTILREREIGERKVRGG